MIPLKLTLFSKQQILNSSKLKDLAGHNLKFDENGRQFSKQKENTVGKGDIAHNEQWLLFPLCFQKMLLQTRKKPGQVWERVKGCDNIMTDAETFTTLTLSNADVLTH